MAATSDKSKTEREEQVALAMIILAEGEGMSSSVAATTTAEEVGVKTRSSASRRSSLQQNHNNRRGRGEPVSENYLNKNKNRRNHGQPGSSEEKNEYYEKDDDNEDEGPLAPDPSPEDEESATDLAITKQEEPNETIICAINPLSIQSIQSSPSPGSPADSLHSTNSGSGGSGAGGTGGRNMPGSSNDCIYMSSSRRIFRPEFKQKVLDAFANDPECVGNQRATARKFGIHRRQVQKWLQQLSSGELTFKDLQQQQQGDNEDPYSEPTELTSSKLVQQQRSSQGNQPSRNSSGKVTTRRSVGGGNIANRQSGNQQQRANIVRVSDPPSRPTRSSGRNKGNKSMPLKGGSKSTSHLVPTIVHPSMSSSSSAAGSPLIDLSKKHQNSGSSTATSSHAYYNNDSNGTNGSPSSSNMYMNMSTFLASAAAAGNLALPEPQDNRQSFSPRNHSPNHYNGRGSPAHSAGGSSGGGSQNSIQNSLNHVEELKKLYPDAEDLFSLLVKALLKEEVSLEKLAHPLLRVNKSTEFRVNGNGLNGDLNRGLMEVRRAATLLPTPAQSTSSREEYTLQNALEVLRQHQHYIRFLHQYGMGNSNDMASALNLGDLSSNGNIARLGAWSNPLAATALPMPSTSSGRFVNSGVASGSGSGSSSESNSRRIKSKPDSNDNHRFASPRVPPATNSNKAKTVAAALAATRVQPSSSHQQQIGGRNSQQNGRQSQNQRNAQKRKATTTNSRQAQSSTRSSHHQMDDDMIDPTSMLEVVTSIPSPANSPATRSNQYGYSSNQQRNSGHNNDHQQGMDLSTNSSPATPSCSNSTTTASGSTRLISKAMNKEYSFLNELGLVRKSPESTVTASTGRNGYGLNHTANLENFVENKLPPRQISAQAASGSSASSSPEIIPFLHLSDTEKKKLVIQAFTLDPDARSVARKFEMNIRMVMKWLKEASVKNSPPQSMENGSINSDNIQGRMNGGGGAGSVSDDEDSDEYIQPQMRTNVQNLQQAMYNESNNNSPGTHLATSGGVNKRKNSKPNQICDFTTEDDASFNGPLDMAVPIKKRLVSAPNPTSHDSPDA